MLRQFPKCIPRKYDVVAIHYDIVLATLSALECSRRGYTSISGSAAHKRSISGLPVSGLTLIILSIYFILRCSSPESSVQCHILVLVISAKCPCKYLAELLICYGHLRYTLSRPVHRNIHSIAVLSAKLLLDALYLTLDVELLVGSLTSLQGCGIFLGSYTVEWVSLRTISLSFSLQI